MRGPLSPFLPRRPPSQVPAGASVIDQTNPLSAALIDFVVFSKKTNYSLLGDPPSFVGNPTFIGTPAGQGLQTPGNASNYLYVPQFGNICGTVPVSVSVLWQPTATPGAYAVIFDTGSGVGRACSLFVDASLNFNYYAIANTGGGLAITTGMVVGGLYEVTMTRDGAGTVNFYVNGVLKGTVTNSATFNYAGNICFGFNITGGGSNTAGNFLRWASWYNRGLTATEVMALANAPFGLLVPPAPRTFFVGVAGGGAVLSAAFNAVATMQGSLSTSIALSSALAGVASQTGNLTTSIRLSSALTANATAGGSLTTSIPLSAALAGVALASGNLSTAIALSSSFNATATELGSLTTAIPLVSALGGVATFQGSLAGAGANLIAAFSGVASMTGALSTAIQLAVGFNAVAASSGNLSTSIPLSSAFTSVATANGNLSTAIALSAALVGNATSVGSLSTSIPLTIGFNAFATAASNLTTSIPLGASFSCSATLLAHFAQAIIVVDPINVTYFMRATAPNAIQALGTVSVKQFGAKP